MRRGLPRRSSQEEKRKKRGTSCDEVWAGLVVAKACCTAEQALVVRIDDGVGCLGLIIHALLMHLGRGARSLITPRLPYFVCELQHNSAQKLKDHAETTISLLDTVGESQLSLPTRARGLPSNVAGAAPPARFYDSSLLSRARAGGGSRGRWAPTAPEALPMPGKPGWIRHVTETIWGQPV